MKKKYKFLVLIICLLSFSVAVFGLNLSILIVQNDGTEKVSVASKTFENEILNYFFDNGHIVCNEPISLFENYEFAAIEGFNAAVDGFMDYFVEIKIDYTENSSNPDAVLLSNIKNVEYKIKKVSTGEILCESGKIIPKLQGISNQSIGFSKFAYDVANSISNNIYGK